MGYRSNVVSVIYGETVNQNELVKEFYEKLIADDKLSRILPYINVVNHARDNKLIIELDVECIKWYDDYDFVIAWNSHLQSIYNSVLGLSAEIVIVGEEHDIETSVYGGNVEYLLYTSVTIGNHYQ